MKPFIRLMAALALFCSGCGAAFATDGVVASIKPIHSMVAAVMEGVGKPTLIVRGAASPHGYQMRPSDAAALENAKVVFWVGPELEPFLEKPLQTLGADATILELGQTEGLTRLPLREGGAFEPHDHVDDDDHHHDPDGAHEDEHHPDGDHDETDMHVWLDPENTGLMVSEITRVLAKADPQNAARYRANAARFQGLLDRLVADTQTGIAPLREKPFIVFHDAYHYFEERFGLRAAGSITVSPDIMPGARRVAEIRDKIKASGAVCVFSEPQFQSKLVAVTTEGTGARTGVLDPIGADIEAGPDLYLILMGNMAASLADCLADR